MVKKEAATWLLAKPLVTSIGLIVVFICVHVFLWSGTYRPRPITSLFAVTTKTLVKKYTVRPLGFGAYQQWMHFKALTRNNSHVFGNYSTSQYHHSVDTEYIKSKNGQIFLVVNIEETYLNGKQTVGGSGFRFEHFDTRRRVCSFEDFFDGSYQAICDVLGPCSNLTVSLMFINFEAYLHIKKKPAMLQIYHHESCEIQTQSTQYDVSVIATPSTKRLGVGDWREEGGEYYWYEKGVKTPRWTESSIVNCISKYHSFLLIGASHVRYVSTYLLRKSGLLPKTLDRKSKLHSYGNIKFVQVEFGHVSAPKFKPSSVLDAIMRQLLEPGVKTKKDVFLVQVGAYDMWTQPWIALENMRLFVAALKAMKESGVWRDGKIIVQTPMPYPSNDGDEEKGKYYHRGYRNNFRLGALTYLADTLLEDLDVEVIDTFRLLLPVDMYDPVCRNHYLCYYGGDSKYIGKSGLTQVDLILETLCPGGSKVNGTS